MTLKNCKWTPVHGKMVLYMLVKYSCIKRSEWLVNHPLLWRHESAQYCNGQFPVGHWVWHHWSAYANLRFHAAVASHLVLCPCTFKPEFCGTYPPTDWAPSKTEPGYMTLFMVWELTDVPVWWLPEAEMEISEHPINVSWGPQPLQQLLFASQSQLLAVKMWFTIINMIIILFSCKNI